MALGALSMLPGGVEPYALRPLPDKSPQRRYSSHACDFSNDRIYMAEVGVSLKNKQNSSPFGELGFFTVFTSHISESLLHPMAVWPAPKSGGYCITLASAD
jgi:hypothetical protein